MIWAWPAAPPCRGFLLYDGQPGNHSPVHHRLQEPSRYTSRYTITLSTTYFQRLRVPSVLFHVVESTCNPLTVTAEAAGSSPVVPAILFKHLRQTDVFAKRPKTSIHQLTAVAGVLSAENFALGSLRSDDRQLGRPTAPPLFSAYSVRPMLALFRGVFHAPPLRQNLCLLQPPAWSIFKPP
jgi:hypothetical protein